MFCNKCGNPVSENTAFCPNCGAKIPRPIQQQKAASQQPAGQQYQQNAASQQYAGQQYQQNTASQQYAGQQYQQNAASQQYAGQQYQQNAASQQYAGQQYQQSNASQQYAGQQNAAYQQYAEQQYRQNAAYQQSAGQQNYGAMTQAKKPFNKLYAIIPAVAVVLVAAIVTGVIFIPGLIGGSYSSDNVFASAMHDASRDSDGYYALEVLAAAHETLFNTESLSVTVMEEGDMIGNGKVFFGKDLLDSSFFVNADNDVYVVYKDGEFISTDGYDAFNIMVSDIAGNRDNFTALANTFVEGIVENYRKQIERRAKNDANFDASAAYNSLSEVENSAGSFVDSYENNILPVVKDHRLNYSALKNLFDLVAPNYVRMISASSSYANPPAADIDVRFQTLYESAAEFAASGCNGALMVSKNGSGSDASYSISGNIGALLNALADFLSSKPELMSALGSGSANMINEIRKNASHSNNDTFVFTVYVQNKHISSISLYDVTISISGINETEISSADQILVRGQFDSSSRKKVIRNTDDIKALMQQ